MARHPEYCRTLLPPSDAAGLGLRDLAATLSGGPGTVRADQLPPQLVEAIAEVLQALGEGHAVTLTTHEAALTTQEAADVLGVSRPTLVRLLEEGAIAYEQPGRHRRVKLHDVLAFQHEHRHAAARLPAGAGPAPSS